MPSALQFTLGAECRMGLSAGWGGPAREERRVVAAAAAAAADWHGEGRRARSTEIQGSHCPDTVLFREAAVGQAKSFGRPDFAHS